MRAAPRGAIIAAAVAGIFIAKDAVAQAYREGLATRVHCDCKGKGWIAMSAEECKAKGGTVK